MEIPFTIFVCVMIGCLVRAFYGWLSSGEDFNKRKFSSTIIFTIFAVALPVASAMMASEIVIIGGAGLLGIILASLIAGWGADSGLKELKK